jgi:hypothetical protein
MGALNFPLARDSVSHAEILAATYSASFVTDPIDVREANRFSIQLDWTNTGVFTFSLESSDDGENPTSFSTITASLVDVTAGSPITWREPNCSYHWIRVRGTRTSGTIDNVRIRATLKG